MKNLKLENKIYLAILFLSFMTSINIIILMGYFVIDPIFLNGDIEGIGFDPAKLSIQVIVMKVFPPLLLFILISIFNKQIKMDRLKTLLVFLVAFVVYLYFDIRDLFFFFDNHVIKAILGLILSILIVFITSKNTISINKDN